MAGLVMMCLIACASSNNKIHKNLKSPLKPIARKRALREIEDLASAIDDHNINYYQAQTTQLKKRQYIVDRLKNKSKKNWVSMHILDDANVSTLNGISFKNDNITRLTLSGNKENKVKEEYLRYLRAINIPRLSFDDGNGNGSRGMNLESIHGVKRWPKGLQEFGVFNMRNFSLISLNKLPDTLRGLRLGNVRFNFDAFSLKRVHLPSNLRVLSIQRCKASHAAISALNFELLPHLSELYLFYFEGVRYSDDNSIYFAPNLEYLCIDYGLIKCIIKTQKPQKMKNLKYVCIKHDNEKVHKRERNRMKQQVLRYFNVSNVDVAMNEIDDLYYRKMVIKDDSESDSNSD